MFQKSQPAKPQPAAPQAAPQPAQPVQTAAAPAQPRPTGLSVISKDIRIVGDIIGDGELQIDGAVKGQVRVGKLIVGEGGFIEGEIRAGAAEVRGRVQGQVIARQVRLYGTANVDGDITHEQLAMETGAFFQGRSVKYVKPADGGPAAAPVASAPAPQAPAATPPAAPAPTAPQPFSGAAPVQAAYPSYPR